MKDLLKWLARVIFGPIGGLSIGLSMPFGKSLIDPLWDFAIFVPLGVILIAISYYYTFIKED